MIPAGLSKCGIYPESETVFFMTSDTGTITFLKENNSKVTGMILNLDGKEGLLKKVEEDS